jgi:hypothetical protein
MIIASAIRLNDGSVFVGMRHDSAYLNMLAIRKIDEDNLDKIDFYMKGAEFGFITDKLVFLDRADAYDEAVSCGQVSKDIRESNEKALLESGTRTILISEDLWPEKYGDKKCKK